MQIRVNHLKSLSQLTLSVHWFKTDFLLCNGVQTSCPLLSITSSWIHCKLYRCNLTWWQLVKFKSCLQFSESKSVLRVALFEFICACMVWLLLYLGCFKRYNKTQNTMSSLLLINFSKLTHTGGSSALGDRYIYTCRTVIFLQSLGDWYTH